MSVSSSSPGNIMQSYNLLTLLVLHFFLMKIPSCQSKTVRKQKIISEIQVLNVIPIISQKLLHGRFNFG